MQDQDICRCEPGCKIPYGYCHCGRCGQKTKISDATVPKHGYVRGEPRRFIMNHDKRKTTPQYIVKDQGYETPCWVWQWHVSKKGYGWTRPYGADREYPAHVVYYEQAKGPVPEGKQLDHLCHDPDTCVGGDDCPHRACVRPDHLEPVTSRENNRRGQVGPGSKHKPGRKPKKRPTHCKHGHEFTPENTYVRPDGARTCKECRKGQMLDYYYRSKWKARAEE